MNMAQVHFVKKARKADRDAGIKKGDSYYWWKFRYGGKHKSKTRPRPSQLTQSGFMSSVLSTFETLEDLTYQSDPEDIRSAVEEAISEFQNQAEECESSLSNMPDSLQESETGQLLQDRADQIRQCADDLEAIDLDVDDDLKDEEREARIAEIIDEIQAVSYDGD